MTMIQRSLLAGSHERETLRLRERERERDLYIGKLYGGMFLDFVFCVGAEFIECLVENLRLRFCLVIFPKKENATHFYE